jgi:hypothetical protein
MTSGARRPLPACRVQPGKDIDISAACFTLVVHDCERGLDGRFVSTEVFGYFYMLGKEHDRVLLQTDSIVVPAGSPIAEIAHRATASRNAKLTRKVESLLRANVAGCSCPRNADCPALNEISLLEALESAAGLE